MYEVGTVRIYSVMANVSTSVIINPVVQDIYVYMYIYTIMASNLFTESTLSRFIPLNAQVAKQSL